jgi:hypothetical protein
MDELRIKDQKSKEIDKELLFSWHAHLFLVNRRKCVFVMNNMTRYNFVMYGLKRADFDQFNERLVKEMEKNLQADQIDEIHVQKYINKCKQISYARTSDRSIISQMNEMILIAKLEMEEDRQTGIETNLDELNRFLNRFAMLKLPEVYSVDAMRNALRNLYYTCHYSDIVE